MTPIAKVPRHIPLEEAYLCVGCQTITNTSCICSRCCSDELYPVSKWLASCPTEAQLVEKSDIAYCFEAVSRAEAQTVLSCMDEE